MRIVTADGRNVAVGAVAASTATSAASWSEGGSVRLAEGVGGRRRTARYATIARTNPWVRGAINARSGPGSRVPIHAFHPTGSEVGARERIRLGDGGPGSGLVALLASPAPRLSPRRWRRRILTDRLTHGTALIEKVRSGGNLVELRWHPWVDVDPIPTADGLDHEGFKVPVERRDGLFLLPRNRTGQTRVIDRDDAIVVLDVDEVTLEEGPVGLPILSACHATHALHDAAMRFAISYMDNGVFPSGVVELHPQSTAAAAQATTELLATLHSRVENAGQPIAIAGRWQQVMATPEGAQLLELARYSREEVAASFGVPLQQLGDQSSSNRSTAEVTRKSFIRDTVGDDVAVLESELNAQLVAPNRRWTAAGIWLEGQLGELLRPDLEGMAKVLRDVVGAPVMMLDEGRALVNLPPLPDGKGQQIILNPGTPGSSDGPSGEGEDDDEDDDV